MHTVDVRDEPAAGVWRSNPCGVLYELAKRDPGQTAELLFGDDSILVFQDARAAVHLLRTRPERYDKNLGAFDAFFGASRLTSDGKRWRALQKLSQPFISATDQAKLATVASHFFTAASQQMLSSRDARGESSVDDALSRAAASVISQVALGLDIDEMSETCLDDFRDILRYASFVTWNLPGSFPVEDEQRRQAAFSARERLRTGLSGMIEKRLKLALGDGPHHGHDIGYR